MLINLCPLPSTIADIMAQASNGWLTLADRYGIKALLLQAVLSDEDRCAIDRLLYAIRRGWLQLEP